MARPVSGLLTTLLFILAVPCLSINVLITGYKQNSTIALADLELGTGKLTILSTSQAAFPAPSFAAWTWGDPSGKPSTLIVGNHEPYPGLATGITALKWRLPWGQQAVGAVGNATPFVERASSVALDASVHVAVHPSGKWAFSASYEKGSVSVVAITSDSGGHIALGPPLTLPKPLVGGKAHQAALSPDGRWLYVPCLADNWVRMYRFNSSSGALDPNSHPSTTDSSTSTTSSSSGSSSSSSRVPGGPGDNRALLPAGSGPRHLAFHPSLPVAYVVNELASTVAVFEWEAATGLLKADFQAQPWRIVSMLPPGTPTTSSAGSSSSSGRPPCSFWQGAGELVVSADGRHLYASNRGRCGGTNCIALFAINARDGSLSSQPRGWWQVGAVPRHMSLAPPAGQHRHSYLLVAEQDEDTVTVFRRDSSSGNLAKVQTVSTAASAAAAQGGVEQPSFIAVV